MFAESFRGSLKECSQFIQKRGWDRPTSRNTIEWEIKRDGIAKTETGEQRFLVLTDREVAG